MATRGRPFEFNHAAFERADGRVAYWAAARTTVLIGAASDHRVFQICQIIFNRRIGSIYPQFSYSGDGTGVAAAYRFDAGESRQVVRLGDVGLSFRS